MRSTMNAGAVSPGSSPLDPERIHALLIARDALQIIEQESEQEWSAEQEQALRSAYDRLACQSSPLGVGIQPPGGYSIEEIRRAADAFKRRLDERYPIWRSPDLLEASKRELRQSAPSGDSARDESTPEVEGQDADQCIEPSPTGADCRCTTHAGPHWLYHDYGWYERNLQELERCANTLQLLCELVLKRDPATYLQARRAKEAAELAYLAFAQEEIPRLQEKICEMTSQHLTRIPYEVLGPDFPDLHERERELRTRIRESLQKMSSANAQVSSPSP